ncbi:hypothetical protein SFUMM280S_11511 [Streptomyces fumanus]
MASHALPRSVPRARRLPAAAPVAGVIALLALPVEPGGDGGAHPADAASAVLVLWCAVRLRPGAPPPAAAAGGAGAGAAGAGPARPPPRARRRPGTGSSGSSATSRSSCWSRPPCCCWSATGATYAWWPGRSTGLALWQGAVGTHQYVTGTGASYQGEPVRAVGTFGPQDVMGMATVVSVGLVCAAGLALGAVRRRGERAVAAGLRDGPDWCRSRSPSAGARGSPRRSTCALLLALSGARRALAVGAAVAAAGVVLVGGLGLGTAMLQERVGSITRVADAPDRSVTDRYTMWAAAVGMWREGR